MANRQLVDYIKEQLSHKMDVNSLRTLLTTQGWLAEDVEDAIAQAYSERQAGTHQGHHVNFVRVAIIGIILAILIVALLLVLFKQTAPPVTETPTTTSQNQTAPVQSLTGWERCAAIADSVQKDTCYVALNKEADYDCDSLPDQGERTACNRAKEQVILEAYNNA